MHRLALRVLNSAAAMAAALFLVLALSAPRQVSAQPIVDGPFGLGVILSDPTGITGKLFLGDAHALDVHVGLDGLDNDRFDQIGFFVDYLFHLDTGVGDGSWGMLFYFGPGGTLVIIDSENKYCTKFSCHDHDSSIAVGPRVPIGLSFLFDFSGELFIEAVPTLYILPVIDFDLEAALGFRYYF